MEKVKLTKEQARAIEVITKQISNTDLRKLTSKEIARCVMGMYEVEPEFKSGNFVVAKIAGWDHIGEIKTINEYGSAECHWIRLKDNFKNGYGGMPLNTLRHAMPEEIQQEKERRWWEKHGRDVWELKQGDLLVMKNGDDPCYTVSSCEDEIIRFKESAGDRDIETIREIFKVACFAESRLDRGDEQ